MSKNVFIITGEASGDVHAAHLIRDLLIKEPTLKITAVGGSQMKEAGANILVDSKELAVIGLFEILTHLKPIRHAYKTVLNHLRNNPPDLLILVDYPGFNLRMAKHAKSLGIKVLYYISPQIWAWKKRRIYKIKKRVDHMAVIFPFEVDYYKQAGVPVTYVGNPLCEHARPQASKNAIMERLNLKNNNIVIGLAPGSRTGEIKRLLPTIINAAKLLQNKYDNLQFVLPLAPSLSKQDLAKYLENAHLNVHITTEKPYDTLSTCHAVIATSGTVTLELALLEIPHVIIYKIAWLSAPVAKILLKTPYVGLCNIVARRHIVKELLQLDASPRKIANEITRIIDDEVYHSSMKQAFKKMKSNLSQTHQQTISQLAQSLLGE